MNSCSSSRVAADHELWETLKVMCKVTVWHGMWYRMICQGRSLFADVKSVI